MRLLLPLLSLLLAAALSCTAVTLDFPAYSPAEITRGIPEPALEAFLEGRFQDAAESAQTEPDSAGALYLLGWLHETGQGVPPSLDRAIDHYRRALDAGHPKAACRLAIAILDHGGAKAGPEARALLEKAAIQDPAEAGLLLGEFHARGLTGPPDFDLAKTWWTRSAEAGEVRGHHNIGRLLDGSFGFPGHRDPAKAIQSFLTAAKMDYPDAMASLGSRLLNGSELIRDEAAGLAWLRKAAASGNVDAHFVIGNYYEHRQQDFSNALRAYHAGAELDNINCLLRAGHFYALGIGTSTDSSKALELFKKASSLGSDEGFYQTAVAILRSADDGATILEGYASLLTAANADHARAQNELALLYLTGRLGASDPSAAAGWFDHAAAQNLAAAQNNLATLFEKGLGVTRNDATAAKLYTQAAAQGHPAATSALARLHLAGRGVPRNLPRAWALANLAASLNDPTGTALRDQLSTTLTPADLDTGRRILADLKRVAPKSVPQQ